MVHENKTIIEKAGELYYQYGIKSITMDDVARELGISKKTLYQFVKNKTDLVKKVVDFEIRKRTGEFKELNKSKLNAIEELFEVKRQINYMLEKHNPSMHYDLRKYYPDIFKRLQVSKREGMFKSIIFNLAKGKKEGLYRKEIDNEIIARIQVARAENVDESSYVSIRDYTSRKFFSELFIYHIRGIANSKGIRFLEDNIDKLKIKE
ncbi:MAG: TetR/AcrR family transcriptional regulator [Bacteroidetes bacterium]|nr:TetR/AcrR family transcriptional regulator [Bacteroidota bacterium]